MLSEARREEIFRNILKDKEIRYDFIAKGESYEFSHKPPSLLEDAKFDLQRKLIEGRKMRRSTSSSLCTLKTEEMFHNTYDLLSRNSTGRKETSLEKPHLNKERLKELSKPKSDVFKQREILKQNKENLEIQQLCTFKPQIYSTAIRPQANIEDRLIKIGESIKLKREKLFQISQMNRYSFHPNVKPSRSKKPLYKRLNEVNLSKKELIDKLTHKFNPDFTFKPSLNSKSMDIIKYKEQSQSPGKKSQCFYTEKHRKSMPQKEEIPKKFFSKRSFSEFIDRQHAFLATKEQNAKCREEKQRRKEEYSHQPIIDEYSKEMALRMYRECSLSQIERLSDFEMARREEARAKRESDYYAKFTHVPTLYKPRRSMTIPEKKTTQVLEDFTFRPTINQTTAQSEYTANKNIMENIEKGILKKNLYINSERTKDELHLQQECTFRPKVNPVFAHSESIKVAGYQQFLENAKKARLLQNLQKKREEKAFGNKRNLPYCVTVPQPFALSQSTSKIRYNSHNK